MTSSDPTRSAGTEARRPKEMVVALAVCLSLVAAANALGLLARASDLALRRFSAWWPPHSLEPLPLAVAGLLILVTAYALATRGSRMRNPRLPKGRRFLPPPDLILLQIGNVTFMAFALILAVVTLGLLSSALRALVERPSLVRHGLAWCLAVATFAALFEVRRRPPSGRPMPLPRRLTRWAGILGGAVVGLWLVGLVSGWGLPQPRWGDGEVAARTLAGLYLLLWLLLAGAAWLIRRERPPAGSTSSRRSLAAASLLSGVAYVGFLTLYLNASFLTLRGCLAES